MTKSKKVKPWIVPFIQKKADKKRGDAAKEWADYLDNPPEGWRVPEDRKAFKATCDKMFDDGYLNVMEFWAEEDGIHFHNRNIVAIAVPYVLHIFGHEFELPGRIFDRRSTTGHVLEWYVLKKLLEVNNVEIVIDEIEYPESDYEKLKLEAEYISARSHTHHTSFSRFRLLWSIRWEILRGRTVTWMYKVLGKIGWFIAPELYAKKGRKR